jgi:MFS family permease
MEDIRLGGPRGRWVLAAMVLGSSLVMLDATIVGVALPSIGMQLDSSLTGLQWTVNAYTLALAGLTLMGGALGDRYGPVHLQVVADYSPALAGAALLPVTVVMLLSARAGQVAERFGPRLPMAVGLLVAAAGMLLAVRIGPNASYLLDVLPAMTVFGLGLTAVVAPLTATVLATADVRRAGVAAGVNNAVARAAGLVAVAAVPPAVGLTGALFTAPDRFGSGFARAMVIAAVLLVAGAVLTLLSVGRDVLRPQQPAATPQCTFHCGVAAPPLEPGTVAERPARLTGPT